MTLRERIARMSLAELHEAYRLVRRELDQREGRTKFVPPQRPQKGWDDGWELR